MIDLTSNSQPPAALFSNLKTFLRIWMQGGGLNFIYDILSSIALTNLHLIQLIKKLWQKT